MQPINLFFYMYTSYNKVIKRNVYGRYFSGEKKTEIETEEIQSEKMRNKKSKT